MVHQGAMRFSPFLHALALLSTTAFVVDGEPTTRCKCLYGQACWPSQRAFDALQSQLSQPLLRPVPIALPCYRDGTTSEACQDVRNRFRDGLWRAELPGVMQHNNFNAYIFPNNTISGCPLDPATAGQTCDQGSIPPLGVDARTPKDVQEAIRFVKRYNLKLVVHNTGHDYLGRSAGRDSFMIWTHHFKDITFNGSFVPLNQPGKAGVDAVTLGAGVQWIEAYAAVHAQGKTIVGGISTNGTVGAAGGWILGGGHSALTPTFGFGVDNVVEFKLVTADGKFLTVNAHTHSRLFWALRGGGGGTFGVVISVTYKLHPKVPVTGFFLRAGFATSASAQEIVTEFVRIHPTLSDKGWGGYANVGAGLGMEMFWLAPNASQTEVQDTLLPFTDLLVRATGGQFINATVPFDGFPDWLAFTFAQATSQVGVAIEISSRLLSKDAALKHPEEVASTVLSLPRGVAFNSVAGGASSRIDPDSTAFHPAWRRAIAEVVMSEAVDPENTPIEETRAAQDRLRQNTKVLDAITTDSASYYNEATLYEVDFRKSFWGSHYPKLKEIKNQYDPTSLFIVAQGVGSEEWDAQLNCRK